MKKLYAVWSASDDDREGGDEPAFVGTLGQCQNWVRRVGRYLDNFERPALEGMGVAWERNALSIEEWGQE